jgi:hypothetical protein
MTLTQIETWLKANGYILKQGFWKRKEVPGLRYNICPKTLRLEMIKDARSDKPKWVGIASGYFSQLYITKDGNIGGMR